ncbi:hypothetical protein [Rhodocytophaga rosea]|uniref:hypothetical protein n=1 Tax=Rhodocytophaga rosea TaxID=2704465 RepID=UPI001E2A1A0B|nr:hypothetical protein [Rhodocytophaga rosea]
MIYFKLHTLFEQICDVLKQAGINLKGLFLNADSGFDSVDFQKACQKQEIMANVKPNPRNRANQPIQAYQTGTHIFDEELYRDRSVVDHRIYSGIHLNMPMLGELHMLCSFGTDGFKALLIRFECLVKNWMSLHFIAFSLIFLRKINRNYKV